MTLSDKEREEIYRKIEREREEERIREDFQNRVFRSFINRAIADREQQNARLEAKIFGRKKP